MDVRVVRRWCSWKIEGSGSVSAWTGCGGRRVRVVGSPGGRFRMVGGLCATSSARAGARAEIERDAGARCRKAESAQPGSTLWRTFLTLRAEQTGRIFIIS